MTRTQRMGLTFAFIGLWLAEHDWPGWVPEQAVTLWFCAGLFFILSERTPPSRDGEK